MLRHREGHRQRRWRPRFRSKTTKKSVSEQLPAANQDRSMTHSYSQSINVRTSSHSLLLIKCLTRGKNLRFPSSSISAAAAAAASASSAAVFNDIEKEETWRSQRYCVKVGEERLFWCGEREEGADDVKTRESNECNTR